MRDEKETTQRRMLSYSSLIPHPSSLFLEIEMNERTRQGLRALEAALLLGVLGDALLRATPWGLNFFLWTSALLAAVVALLERFKRRGGVKGAGGWLLWPIILSSAAFAW